MHLTVQYLTSIEFLPLFKLVTAGDIVPVQFRVANTALHSRSYYVLKRALLAGLGSTLPLMPRALRRKLVIVGDHKTGKVL